MDQENTRCQNNMLVDLLESQFHQTLQRGKAWNENAINWNEIATILNDVGPTFDDGESWKTHFEKLKTNAKQKVGRLREELNKTGGGPPSNLKLTDLENKILMIYGKNKFDGLQGVGECGFGAPKFKRVTTLDSVPPIPLQKNKVLDDSSKSKKRKMRANRDEPY